MTASGVLHRLPEPFFVLATQNPIEQEGTYPLPEAQLDRFMFNIKITYPSENEELEIIRRTTSAALPTPEPVLSGADVMRVQELVRECPVPEHVVRYALRLVRATRIGGEDSATCPQIVRDYLGWGAGPRASQYMVLAAKAKAVLQGGFHVTADHIRSVAAPVLRHRIIRTYEAEAEEITSEHLVRRIFETIEVP